MSSETLSPASALDFCHLAIRQIQFARQYTRELLDATPQEHWLTIPAGMPSSIAWQVGHLTVSQYGLLMFRQRGRLPIDLDLLPGRFRKQFARGSRPRTDCIEAPGSLLQRFHAVHQQALSELSELVSGESLLEPIEMPYAVYPNKLGAILFCPLHEQIHAGQIGLIRRSLGLPSLR